MQEYLLHFAMMICMYNVVKYVDHLLDPPRAIRDQTTYDLIKQRRAIDVELQTRGLADHD